MDRDALRRYADDVAEVDAPARETPRWLRPGLIAAAAVVAGVLVYLRLTGSDVSVASEAAMFPRPYTVEVLVHLSNKSREPLEVVPLPADLAGLAYRGTFDPTSDATGPTSLPLELLPRGEVSFAMRWQVEDCGQVRSNTGDVALQVRAGPPIGIRELVDLRVGTWQDFLPPICRTRPDRGVPLLAGQEVRIHDGRVFAEITILNGGGRALQLQPADLPPGWSQLTTSGRDGLLTIPVGRQQIIWYSFLAHDCQVPEEGPARLTLRFDSRGTSRTEVLPITLADSWANLLGVCSAG